MEFYRGLILVVNVSRKHALISLSKLKIIIIHGTLYQTEIVVKG